ncbi:ester cyclase [Nocardia sp. NPDC059240]|uniref:ester cyclase n=1 Tax=Nocardia sp. NPDC059240 TaxID=3346786 RepID=UPI0036CC7E68
MRIEQNKATFKLLHDVTGSGDVELVGKTIREIARPDAVLHVPFPMEESGAEALVKIMLAFVEGYPDIRLDVQDMIGEGDKVVGRTVVTGTNTGPFMGRPATGKAVRYNEIFIMRFVDGQIAEVWGVADTLTQFRQLGIVDV